MGDEGEQAAPAAPAWDVAPNDLLSYCLAGQPSSVKGCLEKNPDLISAKTEKVSTLRTLQHTVGMPRGGARLACMSPGAGIAYSHH